MKVSCVHHRWVFFFPFYYYIFFFIFRQQQMKNCPIGKYIIYSEHIPISFFKTHFSSIFSFLVLCLCVVHYIITTSILLFLFYFSPFFFFFFTSILSQRSYNGSKTTTHIKKRTFYYLVIILFPHLNGRIGRVKSLDTIGIHDKEILLNRFKERSLKG